MTYPTIKTKISELAQTFQKLPQKAKNSTSLDRAQNFRKFCFNIDGQSAKPRSLQGGDALHCRVEMHYTAGWRCTAGWR